VAVAQLSKSGFHFTECSDQESSSDFKYKRQESLAAILNLRNTRVLFIMAKRHPVRNSQFMKVIRDVHSFFQEESFKITISQYKPSVFEFPTGV
jgi:hypothetical protein